jgi:CBS domain-containing protein
MLKLSEIMTRDVVTVTPETTLRDAVELFTEMHISGAPVVSGRDVVGVVSASDILEFAASTPESATESHDEPAWSETSIEDDVERADTIPGTYYTDLYSDAGTDVVDRMVGPAEGNVLDGHTVDEVMTRDAIALSPNDSAVAAADAMRRHAIHRVLVVDDGVLVGILSTLDLARAVADQQFTTKTYVFNQDRVFDSRALRAERRPGALDDTVSLAAPEGGRRQ